MRIKQGLAVLLALLLGGLALAQYQQSPFFDARDLPPVEERLPMNPLIVETFEGVSQYGGTLRYGIGGNNPGWGGLWYVAGWENLVYWTPDFSGVQPNIAESWEVNEDATEFTFTLREGIKWSDGAPFTAADVSFYVEDILFNEELRPGGAASDWLPATQIDGFQYEQIDDYTFKLTFPNSYGTFMLNMPTWSGREFSWFPRHYLEQFHADYNENIDELVAQEDGIETWTQLFESKAHGPVTDNLNYFDDPARPTLFPWVVVEPLDGGNTIRMERNPYYWKVDAQGNQLPYIDEIVGTTYEDLETRTLAMLSGDIDYIKDPGVENRAAYHQARDEGAPLDIRYIQDSAGVTNSIHFNRTLDDPMKAEIFANKDFRIGLSHAINRGEIIEIVHSGQGEPAQPSPLPDSPLYNERLATQYTEYDLDLANEHLDRVLPDKDAQGFRLGPDGERFTFVMSVANSQGWQANYVQVAELVKSYFAEVGVDVIINAVPHEQFNELTRTNAFESSLWTGEGGAGLSGIVDPRYYVPGEFHGHFGNAWYAWRVGSSNRTQVEMPEAYQALRQQYEDAISLPNQEDQIEAMKAVLEAAADEFYAIGISRPPGGYYPGNSRLVNLPDTWVDGWIVGTHKILFPEQWAITE